MVTDDPRKHLVVNFSLVNFNLEYLCKCCTLKSLQILGRIKKMCSGLKTRCLIVGKIRTRATFILNIFILVYNCG